MVKNPFKFIPAPREREEAKLNLLKEENQQAVEEIMTQMTAILAEAQSTDPWTSHASPAFLYVVYVMLLAAIPESIIQLFGVVMLGYIGGCSWEKVRGARK